MAVSSLLLLVTLYATQAAQAAVPNELFSPLIPQKVLTTSESLPSPIMYPQYTNTWNVSNPGKWQDFIPDTWTSGFFPASLYALNTRKNLCGATDANALGTADWLELARSTSSGLIPLEHNNTNLQHDVGFVSFPFSEELLVNPQNQTAKDAVNAFAADLAARFNAVVGCTRSWDTPDPTDFTVIIDNMMNLEVLWASYALTGNETLKDIAITHANTTMINHFREDGSTWHVVEYNSTTGQVIRKRTSQGFSDNSTWSRGQAWAIYGFVNMYNHTQNPDFLQTAQRAATYFLDNMPSDGIVPDFNAPLVPPPRPADSSAATIAANGLLFLSQVDASQAEKWSSAAVQILSNITTLAWDPSWQSLLSNGTVNWPADNFLTGIVYGDYYYIKAGNTLIEMGTNASTSGCDTTGTSASSSAGAAGTGASKNAASRQLPSFSLPRSLQDLV
ncbi:glycoside hydrolase family 88 protein [Collybiopsis luxurians FD-317 M1]|uniref:Glycoside hydrolase family 88 protein n=1 Tax=Collybiopsis luxurians FD-317 M1 TaxID=944289 RepID=A0A0D0BIG9_9AGAR|nr:glycoside hydrolase family 88 protein [Collybiopsis luxurians FD-317 M1]